MSNLPEILQLLKEPFPPELHQERSLPGGGKWFFIRWQDIRERLDQVCPSWEIEYGQPVYIDKYCVISCKLTICGVTRQELGNAEIELLSSSGKDMSRGTPIERARADAFKNAAEAFGVCAYLDDQSQNKREFTIRYLHKQGDGRALKTARDNGWVEGNLANSQQRQQRAAEESESRRVEGVISGPQRKRLWAIAMNNGYTEDGFRRLIEGCGFSSSKLITTSVYDAICEAVGDPGQAAIYNKNPQDSQAA